MDCPYTFRLAGGSPDGCLISRPGRCLADAMTALIELKLSANPQFQDRPGACKLIETAVSRVDPSMAPASLGSRAN